MDFIDRLKELAARIEKQRSLILTEEAAKNAFVLPFIAALGYDIFNPTEVIPEFVADVGIKKGEKVDYAILQDGKIIILLECKLSCATLDIHHASQLYRYFSVTDARIAILTDGIVYRFFTDLEKPNRMDPKPFLEINMLDLQEQLVGELKRLTKQEFDIDDILGVAGELKYTREIRKILVEELADPSPELVKLFASRVYSGRLTESVRDQFQGITRRAFQQFIRDKINERLRTALSSPTSGEEEAPQVEEAPLDEPAKPGIETTDLELEGYYIVKAILCKDINPSRIVHRDTISYMGVLLDDNNRKPICRLHFNRSQKYLGLFDAEKNEERVPIKDLNEIYDFSDRLKQTVQYYEPSA